MNFIETKSVANYWDARGKGYRDKTEHDSRTLTCKCNAGGIHSKLSKKILELQLKYDWNCLHLLHFSVRLISFSFCILSKRVAQYIKLVGTCEVKQQKQMLNLTL